MKIKKLKVKIKCACADHYLELLKSFDGFEYTYLRQCTKCGKVWVDVEKTYDVIENITETVTDVCGNTITLFRPVVKHILSNSTGNVVYNSVCGYCYVMNKDGTISMIYNG